MHLIQALHDAGSTHIGSLDTDFGGAIAAAINAARLHGRSQLLCCSNSVEICAKAKRTIEAMTIGEERLAVNIQVQIEPELGQVNIVDARSLNLADITDAAEAAAIRAAINRHGPSREKIAEALDISPTTLWRKTTRHNITLPQEPTAS